MLFSLINFDVSFSYFITLRFYIWFILKSRDKYRSSLFLIWLYCDWCEEKHWLWKCISNKIWFLFHIVSIYVFSSFISGIGYFLWRALTIISTLAFPISENKQNTFIHSKFSIWLTTTLQTYFWFTIIFWFTFNYVIFYLNKTHNIRILLLPISYFVENTFRANYNVLLRMYINF